MLKMPDFYGRMAGILENTGLYNLKECVYVPAELAAYAKGLSCLWEELYDLLRETHLDTAQGLGLSLWEEALQLSAGNLSARNRRAQIQERRSWIQGNYDPAVCRGKLQKLFPKTVFSDNSSPPQVYIDYLKAPLTPKEYKALSDFLEQWAPAQAGYFLNLPGLTWAELEGHGLNWLELDALHLRWCLIDGKEQ